MTTKEEQANLENEDELQPKSMFAFKHECAFSKFCATIFGITALTAWNSFLSAIILFVSKFSPNYNFSNIYSSIQTICSQIGLMGAVILNTLLLYRYNRSVRIYVATSLILGGFIGIYILSSFSYTTYSENIAYFAVLMIIAAILNSASSIMQTSFFAVFSYYDFSYLNYYLYGQAIAGLIFALFKLLLDGLSIDLLTSSYIYFSLPLFLAVFNVILYILFKKQNLYVVNVRKKEANLVPKAEVPFVESLKNYKIILAHIWKYCAVIFLNFCITLIVFPPVPIRVASIFVDTPWANKFFVTFHVFVLFNLGDLLGRIIAAYIKWPDKLDYFLIVLSVMRLLFIPAYLYCNINTKSQYAKPFAHDACPIVLMLIFAITNGAYGVFGFDKAHSHMPEDLAEQGNNLVVFFLCFGLCCGGFLALAVETWMGTTLT